MNEMNENKKIKNRKKRKVVNAILLSSILLVGVSITLAYFFSSSEIISNIFVSPKPSLEVVQVENGKQISIKNTGNVDLFVRVHIQNLWEVNEADVGGEKLSSISAITPDPKDVQYKVLPFWISESKDGYYYYSNPLEKGQSVDFTNVDGIKFTDSKDGFTYQLNVLASGIQINYDAVTEAWGIDVMDWDSDVDAKLIFK